MGLICAEIPQRLFKLNGLNATSCGVKRRRSNQTDHLIVVECFLIKQSLRQLKERISMKQKCIKRRLSQLYLLQLIAMLDKYSLCFLICLGHHITRFVIDDTVHGTRIRLASTATTLRLICIAYIDRSQC